MTKGRWKRILQFRHIPKNRSRLAQSICCHGETNLGRALITLLRCLAVWRLQLQSFRAALLEAVRSPGTATRPAWRAT
jgi:hypothetical protein